jgi:hypothetical protein
VGLCWSVIRKLPDRHQKITPEHRCNGGDRIRNATCIRPSRRNSKCKEPGAGTVLWCLSAADARHGCGGLRWGDGAGRQEDS